MCTLQDIDSSPLSPMSDLLSDLSNLSSPSTNQPEYEGPYLMAGQQQQQHVEVPMYDYGVPTCYQPYENCYWLPRTLPQQDNYYSPSYPQPQPQYQSISEPYENLETEGKCRTKRVPYTYYQLDILEERFKKGEKIGVNERDALAEFLNLTPKQVKVWFQNRRTKKRNVRKVRERKEEEMRRTSNVPQVNLDSQGDQEYKENVD